MDAIDALSRMLAKVNNETAQSFFLPVIEHEQAHQKIQTRMQRLVRKTGDYITQRDFVERIKVAVDACRSRAKLDFRQLRLACMGCTMVLPPDGYTLLGDGDAMAHLLWLVDAERNPLRFFVKLYGRLLKAYFGHPDASEYGNAVRERLREFLAERADIVAALSLRSSWTQVIAEHPDLLEEQPGHQFANDILSGNWTSFKVVCERLGLTGETWLSCAVLLKAAAMVTDADDQAFKVHIAVLLRAIDEKRFATLRDEILAKLIERYHGCRTPEVHNELRDFAVAAWKNPWLPLNQTSWGRVSNDARQMISNWLKLDLVSEFFNRLAEDGTGDRRRFEFWRRYLDQIDDMYFILGDHTSQSTDKNIRTLISKLEGRLRHLVSPDSSNNAFIMLIGNAAIVESSKKNNATYIYQRQRFPVSLDEKVSINISELRSPTHVERLIHRLGWQDQFKQKLLARFGLQPDNNVRLADVPAPVGSPIFPSVDPPVRIDASVRMKVEKTDMQTSASPMGERTVLRHDNTLDEIEFYRFVLREKLRCEDLRMKGGCLWVLSNPVTAHVEGHLKHLGFNFKPGKGWWLSTTED